MRRTHRLLVTVLAAALSASVIACGDSLSTESTVGAAVPIESTSFASSLGVNLAASTKSGTGLYYRDLVVGTSPTVVRPGQSVTVHYTGWLANGTKFDSSIDRGTPYTFTLGAGRVIAGWDEGIVGMRVGGKRQLVIPPSLGYGASGNGPIPPNAVLVFEVQVVSVQ